MLRYSPLSIIVAFIAWYFGVQGMIKQFSPSSAVTQPSNSVEETDNVN